MQESGLISNIILTLKFMTSQLGLQTIAIHILSSISQNKINQTMKLSQLREHNKKNISLQNYIENEAGRLVQDLVLFFKKA